MPLRRKAVYLVPPDVVAKVAARAARDQAASAAAAEADLPLEADVATQPGGAGAVDLQAAAEQEEPWTPAAAPETPSSAGEILPSPFANAQLQRVSTDASMASQSSGAVSALDCTLLRSTQHAMPSHRAAVVAPADDARSSRASAGSALRQRQPLRRRLYGWLLRWVLRPLFGYDPDRFHGEWTPPDGYDARCARLHACLRRHGVRRSHSLGWG